MLSQNFAFSYIPGTSIFHKCPALVKIILLPVFSVLIFVLPLWFSLACIIIQFICGLAIKISARQILKDLMVVFFYALMLALVGQLKANIVILVKLLCLLQAGSLFFRTTTSLQLRHISDTLALFVCFIPMVSKIWNQCEKAWYVRGGKNSIKKIFVLLPVFFSVGMKQAWNQARAVSIRKKL